MHTKIQAKAKFELYRDEQKGYYFRLKSAQGSSLGLSCIYTDKTLARKGIDTVRQSARYPNQFETYMDVDNYHYFRLKSAAGRAVLASQAFEDKTALENCIEEIKQLAGEANLVEVG